jgi:hypothetical protein
MTIDRSVLIASAVARVIPSASRDVMTGQKHLESAPVELVVIFEVSG